MKTWSWMCAERFRPPSDFAIAGSAGTPEFSSFEPCARQIIATPLPPASRTPQTFSGCS
ncbi:MAG: hypothetical protein L6W00_19285 [Lentisphaeria bacterium]|nr:MAG: hypothetical protein L6W00_19285 [Lentisphaeria bacterium]